MDYGLYGADTTPTSMVNPKDLFSFVVKPILIKTHLESTFSPPLMSYITVLLDLFVYIFLLFEVKGGWEVEQLFMFTL